LSAAKPNTGEHLCEGTRVENATRFSTLRLLTSLTYLTYLTSHTDPLPLPPGEGWGEGNLVALQNTRQVEMRR